MVIGTISLSKDNDGYYNAKGNWVFRYLITANKAGQDAFEAYQLAAGYPANRDETTGKLLFQKIDVYPNGATLSITANNKLVVADPQGRQMEALVSQYARRGNTALADKLLTLQAEALMGNITKARPASGGGASFQPADNGPEEEDLSKEETEEEIIARDLADAKAAAAGQHVVAGETNP